MAKISLAFSAAIVSVKAKRGDKSSGSFILSQLVWRRYSKSGNMVKILTSVFFSSETMLEKCGEGGQTYKWQVVYTDFFRYAPWAVASFFIVWASSCNPLLRRTGSRGRCWAAIRLSRHPVPSGHALRREADGLDSEGQHGQRSVPLRQTHEPQKGPYPICVSRNGKVRHRCAESVKLRPRCSWQGYFRSVGSDVGEESTESNNWCKLGSVNNVHTCLLCVCLCKWRTLSNIVAARGVVLKREVRKRRSHTK